MNPILGVFFHWLGGLASGSFYVPYKGVKRWSWETYWLVGGFFSWLIAPWFFAMLKTTDVLTVLSETSGKVWFYSYLFGLLWGFGGLTFGLAMRYLGMSLGMAVALGYCTVFGMLIPPLFKGEFATKLLGTANGRWILTGLAVCVAGIVVTALAGHAKEGEMSAEDKRNTIREFDFKKGLLVATFSGIMSACFAFGLSAGDPIRETTLKVDMANSAAREGKAIVRATQPDAADVDVLLARVSGTGLFATPSEATLPAVVSIIEGPFVVRQKPDQAAVADELRNAEARARTLAAALDANSGPVSGRLAAYASRLAALAQSPEKLAIVAQMASLSEKETALAVSESGADLVAIHARHALWTGLPVLIVVLLGGFTTNFIWCLILNIRNRTGYQYFTATPRAQSPLADGRSPASRVPLLANYLLSALAGTIWYFQFFFYSMGETQMGQYKFSSWTLHMASIIIFSSIWGLALHEWRGASAKARGLLFAGIAILILSTLIIGYGNYLG